MSGQVKEEAGKGHITEAFQVWATGLFFTVGIYLYLYLYLLPVTQSKSVYTYTWHESKIGHRFLEYHPGTGRIT